MSENDFLPLSSKKIDYFNEPNLEIHITTLFGTIIDMKVAVLDTVREIKQRIQRVEGIPMYQQNLLFQSKELKDYHRLCDIGIKNGSRLQLITAMKGGPMSTRRLASTMNCEHFHLKELKELLENTRDEIEDRYQQSNTKVSLLIFKNGDILNLLRVIENDDGTYSPYQNNSDNKLISSPTLSSTSATASSSSSSSSANQIIFEKLIEDTDMMMKLTSLRRKMDNLQLKRRYNNRRPDDDDVDDKNKTIEDRLFGDKYRLFNNNNNNNDNDDDDDDTEETDGGIVKNLKIFEKNCDIDHNDDDNDGEFQDKAPISSLYSKNKGLYSYTKQNYARMHKKANNLINNNNSNNNIKEDSCNEFGDIVRDIVTTTKLDKITAQLPKINDFNNIDRTIDLPPVLMKKKARCNQCNKRLNITNIYNCRCGKIYCSIHRYSELHQCDYDYKNEGKNLLKTQNPLIQAEKINKI